MPACGTGRLSNDAALVDRLTPGITTVADATSLLGPHMSEKGFPNGQRRLQWSSAASPPTPGARRVVILFGEDGRMLVVVHAAQREGQ